MNNSKWETGRAFKAEETVNSNGPKSMARAEEARKKRREKLVHDRTGSRPHSVLKAMERTLAFTE